MKERLRFIRASRRPEQKERRKAYSVESKRLSSAQPRPKKREFGSLCCRRVRPTGKTQTGCIGLSINADSIVTVLCF